MILKSRNILFICSIRILIISLLLSWTYPAVELFNQQGRPHKDYNARISALKNNDMVTMPDGKKFRVIEKMTHGHSTAVLKVRPLDETYGITQEFAILRLPKRDEQNLREAFQLYLMGIDDIEKTKLDSPKHYILDQKYIVTEFIEHSFNADQFLAEPHLFSDDKKWQEAADALKKYALDNMDIIYVGDFRAEQLIYDTVNSKWRLVDWYGGIDRYRGDEINKQLFTLSKLKLFKKPEYLPGRNKKLLTEINDEITKQRLVIHYNNRSSTQKKISSLSELLQNQEDFELLYAEINKFDNVTYNEALLNYYLKDELFFKTHKTKAAFNKFFDFLDQQKSTERMTMINLKKAELVDQAFANQTIFGHTYIELMQDIMKKVTDPDEMIEIRNKFGYRKEMKAIVSFKGLLARCLSIILGR